MPDCLIAFGSNEGDRLEAYLASVERLNQTQGLRVTAASKALVTAAVGGPENQAAYLNGAIQIESELGPHELHRRLIEIENELGRIRRTRWGSRTIDLDLLLYGQEQIKTAVLTVPHPRMSFRRFVLEPACEIAGNMFHPTSGQTLNQLMSRLNEAKDLILCVCNHPFEKWLLALREEIKTDSNSNWDLRLAKQPSDFRKYEEQAKLVTFFPSQPKKIQPVDEHDDLFVQLRSAAISFAGPTLELPMDKAQAKREIFAAIESMTKLT